MNRILLLLPFLLGLGILLLLPPSTSGLTCVTCKNLHGPPAKPPPEVNCSKVQTHKTTTTTTPGTTTPGTTTPGTTTPVTGSTPKTTTKPDDPDDEDEYDDENWSPPPTPPPEIVAYDLPCETYQEGDLRFVVDCGKAPKGMTWVCYAYKNYEGSGCELSPPLGQPGEKRPGRCENAEMYPKYCYCDTDLCNGGSMTRPDGGWLGLLLLLGVGLIFRQQT